MFQSCNTHEENVDVKSEQVCLALYTDAHKAEAFGKDNVSWYLDIRYNFIMIN